eukprot:m.791034 g.791034  ORF g.791034 m.791034 type:complete len:451 (-) comp23329_c0_seq8:571-1923(-)
MRQWWRRWHRQCGFRCYVGRCVSLHWCLSRASGGLTRRRRWNFPACSLRWRQHPLSCWPRSLTVCNTAVVIPEHDGSDAQPRFASRDLTLFLAREERRFQRIVEDAFALRVAAAKTAQANYEVALTYHVDDHIPRDADTGNTSRMHGEHWHRSKSKLRIPSKWTGRSVGTPATSDSRGTGDATGRGPGTMASTHGTSGEDSTHTEHLHSKHTAVSNAIQPLLERRTSHEKLATAGQVKSRRETATEKHPTSAVGSVATRGNPAPRETPANTAPARGHDARISNREQLDSSSVDGGVSQRILSIFTRPDASSTPGVANGMGTPFSGSATLRSARGSATSVELLPLRGALPPSDAGSTTDEPAVAGTDHHQSYDDVVPGGTAWNGDFRTGAEDNVGGAASDNAEEDANNGAERDAPGGEAGARSSAAENVEEADPMAEGETTAYVSDGDDVL